VKTFEQLPVIRIRNGVTEYLEDSVVTEVPLTILLNGEELATVICTPEYEQELAMGFLFSEHHIESVRDLKSLEFDEGSGVARVETMRGPESQRAPKENRIITPGCFFYTAYIQSGEEVESDISFTSATLLRLIGASHRQSDLYRETGGVHSAALCSVDEVEVFREDIGRHNAVDKVIGHCLLAGRPPGDHILLTSGRISSALLAKIVGARIPVVASSSAPTTEAVTIAQRFGITLIGFARGKRITVYAGAERVLDVR
jgi:FdhD protein